MLCIHVCNSINSESTEITYEQRNYVVKIIANENVSIERIDNERNNGNKCNYDNHK
jgi:hypothetical protein